MKKIMKKLSIAVLILAVCAGLGYAASRKISYNNSSLGSIGELSDFQKNAPIEIPNSSIMKIQDIQDNEKPVLAVFYVDWCTYCRRFMPIFGETAMDYSDRFNFAAVHCEKPENEQMVKDFGIHGFPSLFIIDPLIDYKFALTGYSLSDKESLKRELDKYLEVRKHFTK